MLFKRRKRRMYRLYDFMPEYVASHAFRTSHRSETLQPKGRPSRASQKV